MINKVSFKDINPFVRFAATQAIMVTVPFICDQNVYASDHRIYFCIEGSGEIYINDVKYLLKPNSILIWRAGLKYRPCPSVSNFTCITTNFDFFENKNNQIEPIPPIGARLFDKEKIIENNLFFIDNDIFNDVIYIESIPECEDTMKEIVRTFRQGFNYSNLFLKGLMIQLFKEIIENIQGDSFGEKKSVYDVAQYIHSHFSEDLNNKIIAEVFNYHPNYLSKIFLEHTGYTLHNYIIKYRLSRALKLLMMTNLPISQICEKVNIPDQHYFSRIFKKYYLMSPSKFRQKQ